MPNVFITGASGCVGHYVVELLAYQPELHLFPLVRDPQKMKLPVDQSRITLVKGDLLHIDRQADLLQEMDAVVHIAAAWGDEERAFAVNVTKTLELFELLNVNRCQRILYFSTASLLDRQHRPIEVASRSGTAYIRSKYDMLMKREQVRLRDRLVTLYPTLLFGGKPGVPYSHISHGVKDVVRWLNVVRFFRADAGFHFIHAEDIAQIVLYLLRHPTPSSDLVLGNPAMSFDECIERVCSFYKKRIYLRMPLPVKFLRRIAFLLQIQLSEWDDYCIQHPQFVYNAVSAQDFGLASQYRTLERILSTYG